MRKKMVIFWVVAPCSLVEVYQRFEAANTSEMSVNLYQTTWHNNPEETVFILAVRTSNLAE
jgi:hypothetical protein